MKKEKVLIENYLENIPRREVVKFSCDEEGFVILEVENTGIANRIAQKLLKKPKISYIHLDKFGSFVWNKIDNTKSIADIAKDVEAEFGEEANPLYERLAKFFQILQSYNFISFI